jgi:hypothetical protein
LVYQLINKGNQPYTFAVVSSFFKISNDLYLYGMATPNTVGSAFKGLNILHIVLCAGVFIILCIMRYFVKQNGQPAPEGNVIFEVLGVAIGFVCVMSARFLFFMRTKAALSVGSLSEKINIFRSAFIVQMALLEGAAILNAMFYLLTRNDIHFFIGIGILLLMIFRRPTRPIAAMVLFNSNEDLQQIYDDSLPL